MTYTRKQVVTCISIVYLILVMALAGYAASRVCRLSIPFPRGLASATTVLPVVSGLLLEFGYDLTRRQERRQHLPRGDITRPPLVIVANTLIFIYSTVVITLLGTHAAPPSGLNCGLRERWTTMFSHKNAEAIRTIQEAYNCCGFQNSRDMAWPFPDKTHKATACEIAFGRTNSCLGPWKGEEQRVAGILMAAVGLVCIWQFAIIVIPTQRESWLHRVAPDRISRMIADERHGGRDGPRQAIDYLPNFSRYSDRVEEEAGDVEAGNQGQRTIDGAPRQAKNALTNGNRDEESEEEENALPENEWLRS